MEIGLYLASLANAQFPCIIYSFFRCIAHFPCIIYYPSRSIGHFPCIIYYPFRSNIPSAVIRVWLFRAGAGFLGRTDCLMAGSGPVAIRSSESLPPTEI